MSFFDWFIKWAGLESGSTFVLNSYPVIYCIGLFVVAIGAVFLLRICLKICDMVLGR